MPDGVRQVRIRAQQIDFVQMIEDVKLLEELANLDIQTGRKSLAYIDQRAQFKVRRENQQDIKAELNVKNQKVDR